MSFNRFRYGSYVGSDLGKDSKAGVFDNITAHILGDLTVLTDTGASVTPGVPHTFSFTGAEQYFTVAGSDATIRFTAYGAAGGTIDGSTQSKGGYSQADFIVPAATTVYVFVGGEGGGFSYGGSTHSSWHTEDGGWNGGGAIDASQASHASGGGATDFCLTTSAMTITNARTLRTSTSYLSRFLVAGGGCGTNCCWQTQIGEGGGSSGSGTGPGGQSGVSGSSGYYPAGLGYGGTSKGWWGGGCGGGAGWYGGRGTGQNNWASGGGGGSGYVYESGSYIPSSYTGGALGYGSNVTEIVGHVSATGNGSASIEIL